MAKPKKLTTPAAPVPQNEAQANEVMMQLGAGVRLLEQLVGKRDQAVADAAAKHQAPIDAATAKVGELLAQLQAYGEANKTALLADGNRSVALAQGAFGWRYSPFAVKLDKNFEEADAIAAVKRANLTEFVRTREELDREAILKEPAKVADLRGISVEQGETFWAKPLALDDALVAKARKLKGAALQTPDADEPKKSKKSKKQER